MNAGPRDEEKAQATAVIEVKEQSPQAGGSSTKYDASKISLVAELKQTDSFGNPLPAIPYSEIGRYQTIPPEDTSLKPLAADDDDDGDDNEHPSVDVIDIVDTSGDKNLGPKDTELSSTQTAGEHGKQPIANALFNKIHPTATDQKPQVAESKPDAETKKTADGGVKRGSLVLVATITVVTNLMKWQMKSKKQAGVKLKSMEKYEGHLEVIQRRSRQEQVELPCPIRLGIRREILPILHSIVKEYRLALGHDHKLTREATAKEEQLRAELAGEGVFL